MIPAIRHILILFCFSSGTPTTSTQYILHIFPPHLLADSVGTPAESLSGHSQVVGLILQRVETFTTLGDLVDVLAHYTDGIIDLLSKRVLANDHQFQTYIAVFFAAAIRVVWLMVIGLTGSWLYGGHFGGFGIRTSSILVH